MDRRTLTFSLPTGERTIKLFTLHPKKPWVAIITHYNTFSLWNYQQKILIKSFSCNTLDESGTVDIRDLIFYDKHCLSYQSMLYRQKKDESLSNMKSNLIFTTNSKIFFYDYITDGIKQINETQMDKKIIKKVSPYSETKICIGLSDGSMKIYDNKESTKNSMTTRTIRGYHSKPITHLFTYCQSAGESPRVISVSASDGMMACWNIETIINSSNHSQVWNPSFKLQSQGQGRQQEIRSLQYDHLNYRLLKLTDNFVSNSTIIKIGIWNTMTGLELRRIKHEMRLKEIYFFDHFSYGHNSFISFSEGPIVQILKISQSGKMNVQDEINLKNLIKQNHLLTIKHLFNWASNPSELFIQTQSGLIAIEINASYRPVFGFNNSFITHLSTFNSKQFVVKGKNETRINSDITKSQAKNAKFQSDALFNSFYLSIEEQWICFNLIEIQIENMYHETKKYKFFKPDASSLLYQSQNTQSVIQVSFDGKSLIIFNRALFYYEIYNAIETQEGEDLLDINEQDGIDFYSKFDLITKGACRDIVWHQYKNQFAAICPFDKNGELITFQKDKQKKGIFSRSNKDEQFFQYHQSKPLEKILKQADNWCACIFVYTRKTKRYLMVEKSKPIKSHLNRILNLGNIFCYSSQEKNAMETIECISQDQNLIKEIQGVGLFPLKTYLSYCQTYQIFVYENYFIVFKVQQNGYLAYHLTIHERVCFRLKFQVMQGMFWQKFFIFSTKNEIYFLQITSTDKVLIKLAEALPNFAMSKNKEAFQSLLIDELQGEILQTPVGQLQFLTIVNQHLMIVNQYQEVILFPLKTNPYVQFCIELACGSSESILKLFKRASNDIQSLMKETLSEYGMSVPTEDLFSTELMC